MQQSLFPFSEVLFEYEISRRRSDGWIPVGTLCVECSVVPADRVVVGEEGRLRLRGAEDIEVRTVCGSGRSADAEGASTRSKRASVNLDNARNNYMSLY